MKPLLVTAFFDIGRGDWQHLARSSEGYLESFRRYLALLSAPRYVVGAADLCSAVGGAADFFDVCEFSELPAYRYLLPTKSIMASEEFKSLFPAQAQRAHIEQHIPEYNVLMMMKWDALERAVVATSGSYTHYVWADFGLGKRAQPRPYLPSPHGFSPIERCRIVLSADRANALPPEDDSAIRQHLVRFREQVAGSLMIIPADKLRDFCTLARGCYEHLLELKLTTDDQLVIDMCVARRPELFYLSYPPKGLSKFNHIHNIIHGLDGVRPRYRHIPIWDVLARNIYRARARRRIGL